MTARGGPVLLLVAVLDAAARVVVVVAVAADRNDAAGDLAFGAAGAVELVVRRPPLVSEAAHDERRDAHVARLERARWHWLCARSGRTRRHDVVGGGGL